MRTAPLILSAALLAGFLNVPSVAAQADAPRVIAIEHKGMKMSYRTPVIPYPYYAKANNIKGKGTVQVSFDEHGDAIKAVMVKSTGSNVLDDMTTSYAKRYWKSDPGNASTLQVTLDFRLYR